MRYERQVRRKTAEDYAIIVGYVFVLIMVIVVIAMASFALAT